MTDPFIREGHNPIPCVDLAIWTKWYLDHDQVVAKHRFADIYIVTVFMTIEAAFRRLRPDLALPPLMYQTVVFGAPHTGYSKRCSSWIEAEAQHARAVELATQGHLDFAS